MSESVILCEGYHDRAFWAGWLRHLGCIDPGQPPPGQSTRSVIRDPWNDPVIQGQFAYLSRTGQFLRVEPCGGKNSVLPAASRRLASRQYKPVTRMIINIDADTHADGTATATGLRQQDVLQFARVNVYPAASLNADCEIEIDGGATKIALIRWEVSDPHVPSLPPQQTLERLVSAALIAAYPARSKTVQDWLAARPIPPPADPKEHA